MRTSKVSQETTKIFSSLSPNRVRRSTRQAAKTISAFARGHEDAGVKAEGADQSSSIGTAVVDSNISTDIEDSLSIPQSPVRKRKRGSDSPATTIVSTTTTSKTWTSPRKGIKQDPDGVIDHDDNTSPSPGSNRTKALPKIPARKTTLPDGTVTIHPPSNWENVYNIVKTMREANPTAPVDTMGCEDLYWRSSSAREKRYHTLTALMLSSQTKDPVTAAAMQRLHTELVPRDQAEPGSSTLTIANILSATPTHLDALISKVGFHNTKTKHIQQTAHILATQYNNDIPSTLDGLLALPGVGPKMAYLCLSAAWGIDAGIGVDVHVHRITNLWGWHQTRTPEETRKWLQGWLPKDRWHEINKLLVGLGQTVCLPVGRRCGECALAGTGLCKGEVRGWKGKAEKKKRVKKKVDVGAEGDVVVVEKEEEHEEKVEIKAELNG